MRWVSSESVISKSLTKKLEHGIKLSEVRVKDGVKNKHVSKNWKKDVVDFLRVF